MTTLLFYITLSKRSILPTSSTDFPFLVVAARGVALNSFPGVSGGMDESKGVKFASCHPNASVGAKLCPTTEPVGVMEDDAGLSVGVFGLSLSLFKLVRVFSGNRSRRVISLDK